MITRYDEPPPMLLLLGLLIQEPLKFLVVELMFMSSFLLLTLHIKVIPGYPWPGYLEYRLPGLLFLVLGALHAAALVRLDVLDRSIRWRCAVYYLSCTCVLGALFARLIDEGTPVASTLGGVMSMVGVHLAGGFWSRLAAIPAFLFSGVVALLLALLASLYPAHGQRATYLKLLSFILFTVILVRGQGGVASSIAGEYLLFSGMLCMAAAIAVQWPWQPSGNLASVVLPLERISAVPVGDFRGVQCVDDSGSDRGRGLSGQEALLIGESECNGGSSGQHSG